MSLPFRGNYLGGRFVRPTRGSELVSEDPGDLLAPVGKVIVSPEAVEEAVESAAWALPRWRGTALSERVRRLRSFQRVWRQRRQALTELVAREAGKPLQESTREVERVLDKVDVTVTEGLKRVRPFTVRASPGVQGSCLYRPIGVMAVIGPFNFPAHTPAGHIIPALALGNTVVFKPSELTPFVGQAIADCFHAAGFPPGVFNLVQGGAPVGARLVAHPKVSGVLFTGSTAAGQAIREHCLRQPEKILALEMGGKNAALILRDADLDLAAGEIALSAYSMGGQRCNATSRVLVDRRAAKAFLLKFLVRLDRVRIGYSLEPEVLMGPLVSHEAVAKFQRYMRLAEEEGFESLRAGRALGRWGKRRGYYVTPAAHLCERPRPGSRYRNEEIFGPDVAILLVRNEEEAVALNNEVPYGLVTSVFTRSAGRFRALLPQIDTGLVNFNRGTIHTSGRLPFGGTKASGSFRPAGLFSSDYCAVPVAVLEDRRPLSRRRYPV